MSRVKKTWVVSTLEDISTSHIYEREVIVFDTSWSSDLAAVDRMVQLETRGKRVFIQEMLQSQDAWTEG